MTKKIIIFALFAASGGFAWYLSSQFSIPQLDQVMLSAFWIAGLYLGFRIILIQFGVPYIKEAKTAYRYRKTIGVFMYFVMALVLLRIWVQDPQALVVSYGIVAAGAAIALQDIIKNIAGGIVLVFSDVIRVGDRVEIEENFGDVIDIGPMNITMLEIRNWVRGDQVTGRIVSVPNGKILSTTVFNFTRDHDYIWDELKIPITYDSDWRKAVKVFKGIAERRTADFQEPAERQLRHLSRKFFYIERNTKPNVFVTPTDNWIEVNIRFITDAKKRREIKSDISESVLKAVERHRDVKIASQTVQVLQ